MTILITGGAGYIGSHTALGFLLAGHEVVVVDNLVNAREESLRRVAKLAGRAPEFHRVDLLDRGALDRVFAEKSIDAVVHCAALKAVGESVSIPLAYYKNNVGGTVTLCEAMDHAGVRNLVFSSSATVYGENPNPPFAEDSPLSATSPYGWTKVMMEQVFHDLGVSNKDWNLIMLRYFNPVGSHPSGTMGEDPRGIPNNLFPFVSQVAVGTRPELKIFGGDYPTPDGTALRDYIHVMDLAKGHLNAVETLAKNPGFVAYNLGTGKPSSVLEVVHAFEKASGRKIAYELAPRRPGDVACSYADPAKAEKALGWKAELTLEDMCRDTWKWQSQNPQGYN